ncbi:glucan endo-1,3-beta-D-glucosidase [Nocardioides sp. Root122]|uniref:beta-1,3-glucanase family protein n=1 Tax=Nocardioides TaxID=1839 RepID=UPI000703B6BF|nr:MULTISPECIES: beta-1,3-glucanase family protein [Nocardioides]KQV77919.1 glucan endo-1,3-beta-D-glucosidase [Nocardioides sp. Root122]MCK9822405.1 beta-1,3-glucanase family protein [Nocardioides cavernae]
MRIRRALVALAALAATLTLAGPPPAALAVGPDRLPFTITNQSQRGEDVYLYVVGVNLATGRLGYVNQAGTFSPWPAGSNPPSPVPDVSTRMGGTGSSTTLNVPRGFSGRIYMSFGERLPFRLTPDGLVQPAPWAPGDPSENILFDWSELTYNDAGLWLNSSQVDMFAVPHAVSVTGADGTTRTTGRLVDDGRNKVINGVRNQAGWAGLVRTRADGTVLRVLAPGKAADAGYFDRNYLDPYIASAWNAYASRTLTVVPFGDRPDVRYFGRTSGTTMTFTNGAGQQVAAFQRPSTGNVWGCDGSLGAPNDQVVGPIARTLCAALHRSTLGRLDTQPSGTAADFYQGSITNHYSRLVHQNMVDGRAYGFAFDDVQAQESLVHSGDPRSAGITLTPFGPGGATTPPPPTGTGSTLVSQLNGKCIDVPSWSFADGQRLVMWDCHGGTNQRWERVSGTLRTQSGMCMDVAGGGTADGTPIQIARCSGNPAQQFVLSGAGDLVNPQANKCVDIKDVNAANGAALQLWTCAGTANQKWRLG